MSLARTVAVLCAGSAVGAVPIKRSAPPVPVLLSWQPPGEAKQVIPVGNLTPHQNNNPPALANVPNFIAARNGLFTFTASATDAEAPAQSLVFSLDA